MLTEIVQVAGEAPAMDPLDSDSEAEPEVAPVIVPPQLLANAGVVAITMPNGKLSARDRPEIPAVWLLVMTRERVVTPVPVFTEKLLAIVGVALTTSVAVAALVLTPAFVDVTDPAPMVFKYPLLLTTFDVTTTVTVQLPDAGIVPPLNETLGPSEAAVTVPLHVVLAAGIDAFVRFVG